MRGIAAWISRTGLRLAGWKVEGSAPQAPRYVLVAAPHTSNWDFLLMKAAATALGIRPHWVGKHTIFKAPFGSLARALGGIPIDRRASSNMVAQLARQFAQRECMALVMPPEGTRGRAPYWKSGFYRVALAAGVPLVLSYVDFTTKTAAIGPTFMPTGDVGADMDVVRAFYEGRQGRYPERQGPIRLEAEDEIDTTR
ncbi:lysophospholipid acyltransferase family protein [Hydrogenophaga sp.]|uniref:lysophospholipid acyltransferase family protein n=1 Tax=Hydrogenophaga sp. TaxID=1904254 RepID=UPI0027277D2C|nr:lysophospholipid acyltransferase family protein [Hydrogenophaga sp.]MDO9434024.1 lysophospholipid acyltransferase family protein [Hydrogenophaga sp.]